MKHACILFDSASKEPHPSKAAFERWVRLVLTELKKQGEVSIYLVDKEEGLQLNKQYRQKDYATNVLAFPAIPHAKSKKTQLLGDLVICVPVIIEEAKLEHKQVEYHFAHITIHGTLHLLGYDHLEPDQAYDMEQLEIALLAKINMPNPYEDNTNATLFDGVLKPHE